MRLLDAYSNNIGGQSITTGRMCDIGSKLVGWGLRVEWRHWHSETPQTTSAQEMTVVSSEHSHRHTKAKLFPNLTSLTSVDLHEG